MSESRTEIYHITHISNLKQILKEGLVCCNGIKNYSNIGNTELKTGRGSKKVTIEPKGVLNDYVPFYLGRRSPMLLQIHTGKVPGVNCSQSKIIYLISSVESIIKEEKKFVFTDGHALHFGSKFYNFVSDFDKLDWDIIKSSSWSRTDEDFDRQRKKQAEFLVYKKVEPKLIFGIAVYDEQMKDTVDEIISSLNLNLICKVKKDWYY